MTKRDLQFASKDTFERILEYAVVPTFDIIVWFSCRGVILLRRKIAPYKNTWALPGLRMMKPEGIEDTLNRIARTEIGITIDPSGRQFTLTLHKIRSFFFDNQAAFCKTLRKCRRSFLTA